MKQLLNSYMVWLLTTVFFISFTSSAQNVGVNETGAAPDASALLDLNSTNKGFLITRADTASIPSPAFGLMTLAPIDSCLYMYNGESWKSLGGVGINCDDVSSPSAPPPFTTCGDEITDARDGQTYGTIEIGDQCWMSENLNYPINPGSWCPHDDNSNCDTHGRLYAWNTASNSTSSTTNPSGVQGICPTGWHLPSDEEWKELEMFLGMSQVDADNTGARGTNEGNDLKSASPVWDGNNSSGFSALPAGNRGTGVLEGNFYGFGTANHLWTATESNGSNAYRRILNTGSGEINRTAYLKGMGATVRCVMD